MEQETREKLLRQCRYYKGERRCPFESAQHALFWRVEQMYVDAFSVQGSRFETLLTEAMKTYLHYGLQDFEAKDGVPMPIKALILNRHLKYMEREDTETINQFKEFYKDNY
jgi:hypothetical protein